MSDWKYIDEEKPTQDGKYLVVAIVGKKKGDRKNFVFLSEWESEKQAFSYDLIIKDRNQEKEYPLIHAWMSYKQPPSPKKQENAECQE
ncbi:MULTISPECIES: hypothetical protein [Glaesserella]|uniref:Uncharacterized protein n=1 Tax=Glaesserella australis TaxID=2094024 RepID=A0A328BXM2_9PAST|nr:MULTISPECIES: hypothetical protein [Glaesserella]AUI65595.1 hypothetical protein CJD39_02945 [Glaesserella sp. 15-184]RAL19118.1 hypothetical protein C5N92_04820 [Glaesserella australis]